MIIIFRAITLYKRKKISDEKTRLSINAAHDICTPPTLIKTPLEEVAEDHMMVEEALPHINMTLKNVNTLLQLTTNLINFERIDVYLYTLYVSECESNSYMNGVCATFRKYAEIERARFVYESNLDYLNVRFDGDKTGSTLRNIPSNALKCTPGSSSVCICAHEEGNIWSIGVKDTGTSISSSEQKKLFRNCFRGSNVINLKVIGGRIRLMLVYKLVKLHKGKIRIQSAEHQGTCVQVTFPKGDTRLHKTKFISPKAPNECMDATVLGGTSDSSVLKAPQIKTSL